VVFKQQFYYIAVRFTLSSSDYKSNICSFCNTENANSVKKEIKTASILVVY